MRWIFLLLLIFTFVKADESVETEHELYLTVYMHSEHFTRNDETDESFNETHKAYGIEYINDELYSVSFNHFVNSRGNDVDAYGVGYLLHFNDSFGLHMIGGYQEGYCLDGFLSSKECTEGKDNKGVYILPLLYYKDKYFKIDFFSNSRMIALRLNIKIYDLF
jgi:hypothetical protein